MSDETNIFGKKPVQWSEDLGRILRLPRRHVDPEHYPDGWEVLRGLQRGPKPRDPLPIQAHAAFEIARVGGALLPIGVGHGKTWVSMVAPMLVPRCQVAVLFIPSSMREGFEREWSAEYERWHLPTRGANGWKYKIEGRPVLWVHSYDELSRAPFTSRLREIGPDLIVCDEAHCLKNRRSVRTDRFLRYFKEFPRTRLVAMSGTFTSTSILDYGHLAELALGDGSPLPRHCPVLEQWATVVDQGKKKIPAPMGKLAALCGPGESARQGFHRRLVETPGVVATKEGSVQCSLLVSERLPRVTVPMPIQEHIAHVQAFAERPDGEELVEQMQVSAVERQLGCGFYYKWVYPRGEPKDLIDAWFAARKAWFKELREGLRRPREGADSPLLLTRAAIRWHDGYHWQDEHGNRYEEHPKSTRGPRPVFAAEHWPAWRSIREQVQPHTATVWLDDFVAADAAEWTKKNHGILWYHHAALGRRVAELSGLELFDGGEKNEEIQRKWCDENDERGVTRLPARTSIICAIRPNMNGKNLQYAFSRNLVLEPPTDGLAWEQMIGRTHRHNQHADEVDVQVYRHTGAHREALAEARRRAQYIEETMGTKQKLRYATFAFDPDCEEDDTLLAS